MKIDTNPEKIERLLTRGVVEVIDREHLRAALLSGKQLRVKLGFDPTGAKIHIGRAIILRKLREFQNLGHKIIFIVGDFTAKIGDPSDKLEKRPRLTDARIKENLKNYKAQVGKIINLKKAEFVFNSKWLRKLTAADMLNLQSVFTVNQMLARRNFAERLLKHGEIGLAETTYALLQGYDSVMLKADVEIGGFDQLFNLKAGRAIQEHYGLPAQDILMTEMLEGTDGRKMSTSWGNVINITDEPNDMFGKVMSVKDELTAHYLQLCTDLTDEEIKNLPQHPKEKKLRLAREIVTIYWGEKAASAAQAAFEAQFSRGETPQEMPEITVANGVFTVAELVMRAGFTESKSEAMRVSAQGGVYFDNVRKPDGAEKITLGQGEKKILRVGPRRFARIVSK